MAFGGTELTDYLTVVEVSLTCWCSFYFADIEWSWHLTCSLITNNCYKLLENQNVTKNKTVRDTIFQILGVMVKRFNHTIGMSIIFLLA